MSSAPPTPTTPLTPGGFNTKSPTIKRILQESRELATIPDPFLTAAPLETNLFEWHFTLSGAPNTPYSNGIYHGRIVLPTSYPLRPPSFRFLTPSGRFEVNREICLSISGHHEETWQPAWGIRTALCAIRAFMEGGAKGQVGGMDTSDEVRERMAVQSRTWMCPTCQVSNESIMKECGDRWTEENQGKDIPSADVPMELRMAYKDDLERGPPTPMPKQQGQSQDEAAAVENVSQPQTPLTPSPAPLMAVNERVSHLRSRAAPPLSPLRTSMTPETAPDSLRSPSGSVASPAPVTARSEVATPQTAVSYHPPPPTLQAPPQRTTVPSDREGVPIWLDRTIQGVVIALVVMLLRQFMAGSSLDDYE